MRGKFTVVFSIMYCGELINVPAKQRKSSAPVNQNLRKFSGELYMDDRMLYTWNGVIRWYFAVGLEVSLVFGPWIYCTFIVSGLINDMHNAGNKNESTEAKMENSRRLLI